MVIIPQVYLSSPLPVDFFIRVCSLSQLLRMVMYTLAVLSPLLEVLA